MDLAADVLVGEVVAEGDGAADAAELVDGDFWFLTAYLGDTEDADGNLPGQPRLSGDASPVDEPARGLRDTSRTWTAAASDTSRTR